MKITSSEFVISNEKLETCPKPSMPEYAFIGRSNVGKSSLINCLTERKGLAKISSTPGKTQLINHFLINNNWYLVDLPGYGYARVSKDKRAKFKGIIYNYIEYRENLESLFILIDSRIPPQKIDLEFLEWCGTKGIPFAIVFTKMDKLSSSEYSKNIKNYQKELLKTWESMPTFFTTSATTGLGRDHVLDLIESINQASAPNYRPL